MTELETVKRELAERFVARATELSKEHSNQLAVTNVILLEELARLELRMRALARATLEATFKPLPQGFSVCGHVELRAIAEGKNLP